VVQGEVVPLGRVDEPLKHGGEVPLPRLGRNLEQLEAGGEPGGEAPSRIIRVCGKEVVEAAQRGYIKVDEGVGRLPGVEALLDATHGRYDRVGVPGGHGELKPSFSITTEAYARSAKGEGVSAGGGDVGGPL